MFFKLFALFAMAAVALADPKPEPKPQFVYTSGVDYVSPYSAGVYPAVSSYGAAPVVSTYAAAAPIAYGAYGGYGAPLPYSTLYYRK